MRNRKCKEWSMGIVYANDSLPKKQKKDIV